MEGQVGRKHHSHVQNVRVASPCGSPGAAWGSDWELKKNLHNENLIWYEEGVI